MRIYLEFIFCIRGRVVEGTGLIIRFPMERHWFEPSRMHFYLSLILCFLSNPCIIKPSILLKYLWKLYG